MKSSNPIQAILDALASPQQQGETSLIFKIDPAHIQDAMNALGDHRRLFVPVIPGQTEMSPIYATYERMRQANLPRPTILLMVECRTIEEYREALDRLPMRSSSEWRHLDDAESWERFFGGGNDSKAL